MIVDRSSRPWAALAVLALAAASAGYYFYAQQSRSLSGGSWPGFAFGVVGSLIIVFCMALSLKKSLRTAPLGPARHWMQAHVWLGLISYPLIWFHAAFRLGGPVTTALMVLFTLVWLSGIIGLVIQHRMPTRLLERAPAATIHDQIAHVIGQLRAAAEAVIARTAQLATGNKPPPDGSPAAILNRFYADRVVPVLSPAASPRGASATVLFEAFTEVRGQLPGDLQPTVSELEQLVRQRLQLDTQRRFQRILHGWLLVHVPMSWAMLLLSIVHAVMALKFRGIG